MILEKAVHLQDVATRLSVVRDEAETVKQLNSRREQLATAVRDLQASQVRWLTFREAGLIALASDGELKNIRVHLKKLIVDATEDPSVLITSTRFSTVLRNLALVQKKLVDNTTEAWENYADTVKPTILPVVLQSLSIQPQKRHLVQQWQQLEAKYSALYATKVLNRQAILDMQSLAAQFKALYEQLQVDALPPAVATFFEKLPLRQATLADIDGEVWEWLRTHGVLDQFTVAAQRN